MKVDEIDKKILNNMLDNSRLSYRQIAKKAGVSVVTVLKRVKTLEKENIIKSYTSELDYEKLGYDLSAMIKLRIAKGKQLDVEKKLAINPNVYAVYDITGDFDTIVLAKFKDRKSMDRFIKKIQTFDFVDRSETSLILNIIKEENIKIE